MITGDWEELLGSAVQKKVIVDGDGDSPDLGNLVVFDWRGRVVLGDGTTGVAFGERKRAIARIGDGDEIPGTVVYQVYNRVDRGCHLRRGACCMWRHDARPICAFVAICMYSICNQREARTTNNASPGTTLLYHAQAGGY